MPYISDTVRDEFLNYLKNNCDKLNLCDTVPTTYTEAITTFMLANVTIDSTDFTLAAGDTSGRKVTIAAQTGVTVTNAGDTLVVALTDSGNTELLAYVECTVVTLNTGNTVNTTSFDIELPDAE